MESPFVCDMKALTPEQRARHHALAMRLRPAVIAFDELPDGYAARFAMEPERVTELAEFVTLERLCCPWITLGVELARIPHQVTRPSRRWHTRSRRPRFAVLDGL